MRFMPKCKIYMNDKVEDLLLKTGVCNFDINMRTGRLYRSLFPCPPILAFCCHVDKNAHATNPPNPCVHMVS